MFLTGFKKIDKKNNKSATEAITYDSKLVSKEKSEYSKSIAAEINKPKPAIFKSNDCLIKSF